MIISTRRQIAVCGVALLIVAAPLRAQRLSPPAMDSLLTQLVGRWEMAGAVRGRPARYTLDATRELGAKYVELHMTDATTAPRYEARVFIGVDSARSRYLVHWIDNTGAANSVPAAEGFATRDTIQFVFAYADGPFRDTFAFDRRSGSWHFLLEEQDTTKKWRTFATYRVTRR